MLLSAVRGSVPAALAAAILALSAAHSGAATVIETVAYQMELALTCGGNSCLGIYGRPGARRRLNLVRVTCNLQGKDGSEYSTGWIELRNADDTHVLYQYLPVGFTASNGIHTLNRAVDMQVAASQHVQVFLELAGPTTALSAACTVSGTLDRLQ